MKRSAKGSEVTVLVPPRIRPVSKIILGANNGVDHPRSKVPFINSTKRATRYGSFVAARRLRRSARGFMAFLNISAVALY